MSFTHSVLSLLGLATYAQEAETIITVSKDGYEAISAAKEMLDSEDGEKFKVAIKKAISAASSTSETSISSVAPVSSRTDTPPAGEYVWDSLEGWVWRPADK